MTRSHRSQRRLGLATRLAAFMLGLALAGGCGHPFANSAERPRPSPKQSDSPGRGTGPPRSSLDAETAKVLNRLLPANALAGDFVIQQLVTVRWPTPGGPEETTFEAALQRRGDSLLLLGFGPMKRVGFELWLEDGRVRFENRTEREMPFRPEDILADVQRVFYPWLEPGTDCTECVRQGQRLALDVEERIGEALLEERRFGFRDRPDLGVVRLAYSGDPLFGVIPTECEVVNEWFGYTLVIKSHRIDRIDEAAAEH